MALMKMLADNVAVREMASIDHRWVGLFVWVAVIR